MTDMDFFLDTRVLGLLICALVVAVATYYEVKHIQATSRRRYLRRLLEESQDVHRHQRTVDLQRYQQRRQDVAKELAVDELQVEQR